MYVECGVGLSVNQRLSIICVAIITFLLFFIYTWALLLKLWPSFFTFSSGVKADFCARVISAIHTLIIVPALMIGILGTKWGENYEPLGDISFLTGIICISVGYFIYDLFLLFFYNPPSWRKFVFHHIIASLPYLIYLFINNCSYGLFVLSNFLLVETTNLPFYVLKTLKDINFGGLEIYTRSLYITTFTWFLFRVINPTVLIFILHLHIIPTVPFNKRICIIPSVICAYVVSIICYVFFYVLCKEVMYFWVRSSKQKCLETSELNETTKITNGSR